LVYKSKKMIVHNFEVKGDGESEGYDSLMSSSYR